MKDKEKHGSLFERVIKSTLNNIHIGEAYVMTLGHQQTMAFISILMVIQAE